MKKEQKKFTISFRVSEDLLFRFEKYCKHYGIKKSKVLIALLNKLLP